MPYYLAKVHCAGSAWIVHVPAVDRWTIAADKRGLTDTARQMVSAVLGVPADSFGIDLTMGRAVGSTDEFAAGSPTLLQWGPCPTA